MAILEPVRCWISSHTISKYFKCKRKLTVQMCKLYCKKKSLPSLKFILVVLLNKYLLLRCSKMKNKICFRKKKIK